jgi:hypothetical protein
MSNEVADFQEADQFQPGKSQFECGYFAVAMAKSMAEPGHAPTLTMQQVIDDAESWYAQYDGTDAITNVYGMTLDQEYSLLQQVGLHYQGLPLDLATIKGWIADGYPVLVGITEVSVNDVDLGGNPYPWGAAGTHVILLTGLDGDNFLVRDSANCTNLYDASSLRPGPRRYNAAQLQFVSATVVVPPWLPRPLSTTPPTQGGPMLPQGWKDDGTTLTAPNGIPIVAGFRAFVLAFKGGWDPDNWPLEPEQHLSETELANKSGAGSRQIFRYTMLVWYASRGVVMAWIGHELMAWIAQSGTQAAQITGYEAVIKTANAQITSLQAQLKAAQQTPIVPATNINVAAALAAMKALETALGIQ